ncbi:hypothetical protein [Streptomyces sp. NPDC085529]|uniref:hypothetical protein n=1 Tax=Streptomyces sp. NPDC085529 TaxID=3365729 RepID=UPI0037CD9E69
MAAKTGENETDASKWEYITYAPSGETCPACMKPVGRLERVRRGELARQSGSPVVVYRHVTCPKG